MIQRTKTKLRLPIFFAFCILLAVVCAVVFVTQMVRLSRMKSQLAVLEDQHDELKIELQRLELYAAYIESDEFEDYYARKMLGLIFPNELLLFEK